MCTDNNETFQRNVEEGEKGVQFVKKYIKQLTDLNWFFYGSPINLAHQNGDAYIEGADIAGWVFGTLNDPRIGFGHAEVKSFFNSITLNYYEYKKPKKPAIGFELWSTSSCTEWGWLYAVTHPEEHNQHNEDRDAPQRAHRTGVLFYVCFCNDDDKAEPRPYMVITMRDFENFFETLKRYAREKNNWDLDAWNLPPHSNTEYWKPFNDDCRVKGNFWNVPLDVVLSARNVLITMVDDPPANMTDDQRQRYSVFAAKAKGRHLSTAEEDRIRTERQNTHDQSEPQMTAEEFDAMVEPLNNFIDPIQPET